MNQLYCPYIWKELIIENDGYISPCLYSTNKLFNTNIKHNGKQTNIISEKPSLHLDDLADMRQKMLEGKWPSQCVNCRAQESRGLTSNRQLALPENKHSGNSVNVDEKVELKHLTFRVGNLCNLRCVMCGPWASNQWYNDYVELTGSTEFKNHQNTYQLEQKSQGKYFMPNSELNADNWENVTELVASNINDLEKISFHGGEPMVSKMHFKVVDYLIKSGKHSTIELEYYTNLYQVSDKFLDALDLFKHVTIVVSLDGVGDVNNAIRWPSKYKTIVDNINVVKQKTNTTVRIGHTISNLNLEHLIDFIKEYKSFSNIDLNFVKDPMYTSLKILDKQDINNAKMLLEKQDADIYKQYNIGNLIDAATGIHASDEDIEKHRKVFIKMWNQFSKKQSQDWESLFPFMHSLYTKWNQNEKI